MSLLHSATISSKTIHMFGHALAELLRLWSEVNLEVNYLVKHTLLKASWCAHVLALIFKYSLLSLDVIILSTISPVSFVLG